MKRIERVAGIISYLLIGFSEINCVDLLYEFDCDCDDYENCAKCPMRDPESLEEWLMEEESNERY